jgi:uncharacterized membrane protein YraQ (UPF0718 family)
MPASTTRTAVALRRSFEHTTADVVFMGRFVVTGAALAAVVQTIIPASALEGVAGHPLLAPLALMLVAFLLSLCSSADALVGASFAQFGAAAQLGFLTFGPGPRSQARAALRRDVWPGIRAASRWRRRSGMSIARSRSR